MHQSPPAPFLFLLSQSTEEQAGLEERAAAAADKSNQLHLLGWANDRQGGESPTANHYLGKLTQK
jgi:hypothetical protein